MEEEDSPEYNSAEWIFETSTFRIIFSREMKRKESLFSRAIDTYGYDRADINEPTYTVCIEKSTNTAVNL